MVVSAGGNCTVAAVTKVQVAAGKLQHNSGGNPTYNPGDTYKTANGWPAYAIGDKVFKVGAMIARSYTVDSSNQLTVVDETTPTAAVTSVLAADIVMLKAQYGVAPVGSQAVNAWVSATAASGFNLLDAAKVRQIKAVRLVIVARSSKLEGSVVTAPCTNVSGGVNKGPCAWPDTAADPAPLIDLSANPNWGRYRYRVYQTVMPIRNVIWAGV